MSQNDTRKWMIAALAGLLLGSDQVLALAGEAKVKSAFELCVDAENALRGVDSAMQNRWNPNRIAGRIQIISVGICSQKMSSLQEEDQAPKQSEETIDDGSSENAATGIRET